MDQGESIEEAVRREVCEEAGIAVGEVRYHSSQPWPFPSSLMIGCHGQAESQDIRMDPEEMADVRWFERSEVLAALNESSPTLKVPGPIAIAHHLIKDWTSGRVAFWSQSEIAFLVGGSCREFRSPALPAADRVISAKRGHELAVAAESGGHDGDVILGNGPVACD